MWARRGSWICGECVPCCSNGAPGRPSDISERGRADRLRQPAGAVRHRAGAAGTVRSAARHRAGRRGLRRVHRRERRCASRLAGGRRLRPRPRPWRAGPVARCNPQPRRQRRHHLHPDRPPRRRDHQRRRRCRARTLAARRAAAGDLGERLEHPRSRTRAALPAAGRGADRSLRSPPVADQRSASPAVAVRPPRLSACGARYRGARTPPAVPARLRRQPKFLRRLRGQRRLDAGPVRRRLRLGRPAGGRARHPGPLRGDRSPARLPVGPSAAPGADRGGARDGRRARRRGAQPRHPLRNRFRPGLSRQPVGSAAGGER